VITHRCHLGVLVYRSGKGKRSKCPTLTDASQLLLIPSFRCDVVSGWGPSACLRCSPRSRQATSSISRPWRRKWQALWRRLFERARIDAQLAEAGLIDWSRPYRNALIDDRYATRLGEGTVTVATPSLVSPFTGSPIAALPVRASWLARAEVDIRDWVEEEQEAVVNGRQVQIGALTLTYDRLGLQRAE